jgi:hypothetical protein
MFEKIPQHTQPRNDGELGNDRAVFAFPLHLQAHVLLFQCFFADGTKANDIAPVEIFHLDRPQSASRTNLDMGVQLGAICLGMHVLLELLPFAAITGPDRFTLAAMVGINSLKAGGDQQFEFFGRKAWPAVINPIANLNLDMRNLQFTRITPFYRLLKQRPCDDKLTALTVDRGHRVSSWATQSLAVTLVTNELDILTRSRHPILPAPFPVALDIRLANRIDGFVSEEANEIALDDRGANRADDIRYARCARFPELSGK